MNVLLALSLLLLTAALCVALLRARYRQKTLALGAYVTNRMPSGVIVVDREGRIIAHNPASKRIFDDRLAFRTPLRDIVQESAALQALLDRCLDAGDVFTRVEFNAPSPQYGEKRIGINLSPVTNDRGKIEGAICLLSDLTEIVELQNRVKLQENFAALGEMSAGIAHEFKNSLATILGYAQMSTRESDVATLQNYAREIQSESQSLSVMVTDFLNFARPVSPSMHMLDLAGLLDAMLRDLRNLRPGSYAVEFVHDGPASVLCDVTLLRQALLNLLINAVDSIASVDAGGRILVRIEQRQDRDGGRVRVAIEDNGPGIPADRLSKIFLPFFTTKAHGTGLGLALVQKIVLAHNGRIEVQSKPGAGAKFSIILPASRNQD